MFCTNCGQQLDDSQLFCPECGTKVQPIESSMKANIKQASEHTMNSVKDATDKFMGWMKEKMPKVEAFIKKYAMKTRVWARNNAPKEQPSQGRVRVAWAICFVIAIVCAWLVSGFGSLMLYTIIGTVAVFVIATKMGVDFYAPSAKLPLIVLGLVYLLCLFVTPGSNSGSTGPIKYKSSVASSTSNGNTSSHDQEILNQIREKEERIQVVLQRIGEDHIGIMTWDGGIINMCPSWHKMIDDKHELDKLFSDCIDAARKLSPENKGVADALIAKEREIRKMLMQMDREEQGY